MENLVAVNSFSHVMRAPLCMFGLPRDSEWKEVKNAGRSATRSILVVDVFQWVAAPTLVLQTVHMFAQLWPSKGSCLTKCEESNSHDSLELMVSRSSDSLKTHRVVQ